MISLRSLFKITDKLFTGKKPPEETNDIAKLKEIKDLNPKRFNTKKINKVSKVYKIIIFNDCFKVSDLFKERKLVKDFFKL